MEALIAARKKEAKEIENENKAGKPERMPKLKQENRKQRRNHLVRVRVILHLQVKANNSQ